MNKRGKFTFWIIFGILASLFTIWFLIHFRDTLFEEPQPEVQIKEAEQEKSVADPEEAAAKFKESVGKTMSLYDDVKYDVNRNLVSVVIDLDAWNATSEEGRTDFMNEIYALIHSGAITSGILEYYDVSVNFMTSDYKNVHPYEKITKGSE